MTDNRVYRTRSLGIPAEGTKDQYADGIAAKLWELYIGDKTQRTKVYRNFLVNLLKEKGCKNLLDVACGTGVDSILLVEEGFSVTSVDLSDKMLKYALKTRWKKRKDPAFDAWVIEEANWLTLPDDIEGSGTFDAVLCLGNSFSHLPDISGGQAEHKVALRNFAAMVKPGGVLIIDHRNYDYIVEHGVAPTHNIYYNSNHVKDIHTSVLYLNGEATLVTLDYHMEIDPDQDGRHETDSEVNKRGTLTSTDRQNIFRLSYYPHFLEKFSELLHEAFDGRCKQKVYGDFQELGQVVDPGFYVHVVEKATN